MNASLKQFVLFRGQQRQGIHAEIVEVAGGNVVNFRYGRRGASLTSGTKTAAPVDFAHAKMIYDKLVKEKTAKGYTPDVSGAAYQGTERAGLKSDFSPQLLNPITEEEAMRLIKDDRWAAQEKMDGERRAAHADGGGVFGINRKGLVVRCRKLSRMNCNRLPTTRERSALTARSSATSCMCSTCTLIKVYACT